MANQENLNKPKVVVVIIPFPAQSHLNQLLQLAHVISSYNIKVHYVASALHISQVKSRASNQNPNKIEFHSLETPEFPSPQPSNPKFPSHLIPSYEALTKLQEPVKSLIASLSETAKRLVVIHDILTSYVVGDSTVSLPNSEAYVVTCVSAVANFVFLRECLGLKIKPEIPPAKDIVYADFRVYVDRQYESLRVNKKAGLLLNTCRVIEKDFLDFIEEREKESNPDMNVWAIGPLETVTAFKKKTLMTTSSSCNRHKCLEWLDEQEARSVLYVSFGTMTFIEDDQIKELAKGLEESGTKFLWVLRDADKANVFEESVKKPNLPLGFEEKINKMGKGMILRDWAPQMEILGHSSIGGFLSHCGWNSCLESLTLGVPLAAWPMHSDQPINAFLVTNILKVGLLVNESKIEEELVSSSEISESVKRLMSSEEGVEVRKRAEELGCELMKCSEEGGVSRMELDSFVAHITRP